MIVDNNIYVVHNGDVFSKDNILYMKWRDKKYTDMSTLKAVELIREEYPEIDNDFKTGSARRIDIPYTNSSTMDDFEEFDEELQRNIAENIRKVKEAKEQEVLQEDEKTIKNDVKNVKQSGFFKGVLASGIAFVLIACGVKGCSMIKAKKDALNGSSISATDEDVKTEAIDNLTLGLKNFSILAKKYPINEKELGIKAEEWLSAYLYANSYDYKPYELLEILRYNPEFYTEMSNHYRNWCEVQTYYNIIGEETSLTKDFFKNEEAYKLYKEYYDLFKKAQKEPTVANKQALEAKTKELFGLEENDKGINTIAETYPGVTSIMGHTITTSAHLLGLINENTYSNAMYKTEKDKNGNVIKVHGPIEKATCEFIENQKFDVLREQILSFDKEDELTEIFKELNDKYYPKNVVTEKDAFTKITEIRISLTATKTTVSNNKETTTVKTEQQKEKISEEVVDKEFTAKEKEQAEEKAQEEFEEEYGVKIKQQEAKKQGIIDASEEIEDLLSQASASYAASNKYDGSDIEEIGNDLVKEYDGKYKSYYKEGVNEAVKSGKKELASIKKQLEDAKKELDKEQQETTKKEETTTEENKTEDTKKEEIVTTPSYEEDNDNDNEFTIPEDTTIIKPITQEELEEIEKGLVRTR